MSDPWAGTPFAEAGPKEAMRLTQHSDGYLVGYVTAAEDAVLHYVEPGYGPPLTTLCEKGEKIALEGYPLITSIRDNVTCQMCKEWLYA